MTDTLKIALAQLNPVVGDIDGNIELIRTARADAAKAGADLVVTSELVVCGYPPEDLVIRPIVQDTIKRQIDELAAETSDGGPALLVGTPWVEDGKLYNAALLLDAGESLRYGSSTTCRITASSMKSACSTVDLCRVRSTSVAYVSA